MKKKEEKVRCVEAELIRFMNQHESMTQLTEQEKAQFGRMADKILSAHKDWRRWDFNHWYAEMVQNNWSFQLSVGHDQ